MSSPVICPPSGEGQPEAPERCDDTAYGRGTGGRLRYRLRIPARGERRLLVAVGGSESSRSAARRNLDAVLRVGRLGLRAKVEGRQRLAARTRLSLPADPLLARGIDWSKQNLADSVQVAETLKVREVREGEAYPEPSGTVPLVRFIGAGWPDYPWLFATDGEYTAFAAVALGQFGPIMDHLRALRDVSRVANGGTGKVVHEVVTDGSVYFGANEDEGNTDETVKFPSAVALLWRWTGDDRFRDEMYGFTVDGMRWALRTLDADGDGWLEGPGNVEREGMGEEKLDVTVYTRGNRRLQLPRPDEQPGAMPEIAPSPDYDRSISQPLNDRAMVLQAWGAYGTAWPVVRQQLGVRPDMGRGRLEIVPQIPPGQRRIAGSNIRIGSGALDVAAQRFGRRHVTRVRARAGLRRLVIGHTLPAGAEVRRVALDGERARFSVRRTNRGTEVVVRTRGRGVHELVVLGG